MSKNKLIFSKNIRNVLATGVITTALAFSSATGPAYADKHEVDLDAQVEETTEVETITYEEEVVDSTLVNDVTTDEDVLEEAPSLIPGDFLYFTKKVMEFIQLTLTFDDVKGAQLLVVFAQERIKEAEALFANGKEELANEVLQKAIQQQELAFEKYEKSKKATEDEAAIEEDAADEDGTNVEEEALENDEDIQEVQQDTTREALEAKFSKNILALQAALEKVQNPQAKASLEKNIEKAQEKLETKINKRLAKLQETTEVKEEELATDEIQEEESTEATDELNEVVIEENEELLGEETEEKTVKVAKDNKEKANNNNENNKAKKEDVKQHDVKKQDVKQQGEKKQNEAAQKAQERKPEDAKAKREEAGNKGK